MRRFPLVLMMGALLATTACQQQASSEAIAAGETAETTEPVVEPLAPEEANALAFRTAWDEAPPVTASDPDPDSDLEGSFAFRQGTVRDLGAGLFALVSSGVGDDGAGAVAIHYLVRTEDGFRDSDVDPLFVSAGTGGEPQWTLRTDLTPQPALVVEARSTGEGRTCATGTLVELTPSHPVLRALDMRLKVEDSQGGADGSAEAQLSRGTVGRDFTLTYTGASEAEVDYVLTDMGFYRAMSEPSLPWC
ncbi:hypothetical protein [Dokdonella sp.]|uniref:hypothetical protein n=1 Tax=Dokdonella sp. TaxID=2291710 RepID=UPI003C53299E